MTFPATGVANVDLDLAGNQIYPSGAFTDYLSCSRASVGYATTFAGTLTSFSSNVLRRTDLGLLVEDARTNIILQSEDFTAVDWGVQATTVTVNQAVAPNGTTTMDSVNEGIAASRHIVSQQLFAPPLTANTNYSFSVFVKDVDRRYVQLESSGNSAAGSIYCYADLQTGTISDSGISVAGTGTVFTSATIEAFTNVIYRVTLTGIVNSADTGIYFIVALSDRATQTGSFDGGNPSYTGTSKSLYVWGAQVEQAPFASSYIPTTTTSAARAADAVTCIGNLNTILSALPQSVVVDLVSFENVPPDYEYIIGDSAATTTRLQRDNSSTSFANVTSLNHLVPGSFGNSLTFIIGGKIGLSQDSSPAMSIVGGGGTIVTDASSHAFNSTTTCLGNGFAGSPLHWNGYFRRLTVWNSRLTDAALQALTSPSYASFFANDETGLGKRPIDSRISFLFTTSLNGIPTDMAGSPAVSVYMAGTTTPITAGVTYAQTYNGKVGLNSVSFYASEGNGYSAGKDYEIAITTGTLGGVSMVGSVVGRFSLV